MCGVWPGGGHHTGAGGHDLGGLQPGLCCLLLYNFLVSNLLYTGDFVYKLGEIQLSHSPRKVVLLLLLLLFFVVIFLHCLVVVVVVVVVINVGHRNLTLQFGNS